MLTTMHIFQVECFHTLVLGSRQLLASCSIAVEATWKINNKRSAAVTENADHTDCMVFNYTQVTHQVKSKST